MESHLIAWDARPREIAADPAATVKLDRAHWESTGARFESYDNEIGGSTAVATGSATTDPTAVAFAVLDDGEPTAYLLVEGPYTEHGTSVDVVLGALIAQGTIASDDILERLPSVPGAGEPGPTTRELEHTRELHSGDAAPLHSEPAVPNDVMSDEQRLQLDAVLDAMLQRARDGLERSQQRARELDARRLRQLEALLVEHGVTGRASSLVLARATRRWRIEATEAGLEVRYEPPDSWRAIAERFGVSTAYARQVWSRVLRKLPDESLQIVYEPAEWVGAVADRRARPHG